MLQKLLVNKDDPAYIPTQLPPLSPQKQQSLQQSLYERRDIDKARAIKGLHEFESIKLNNRLLRNAGGQIIVENNKTIAHKPVKATDLITITEMSQKLARVPQNPRTIGNKCFNTERKLSVPDLPIDPPNNFVSNFYNLLTQSPNPFNRRGTEISEGYDKYKLRKNSVSLMHNDRNSQSKLLSKVPSTARFKNAKSKVTFALQSPPSAVDDRSSAIMRSESKVMAQSKFGSEKMHKMPVDNTEESSDEQKIKRVSSAHHIKHDEHMKQSSSEFD